MAAGAVGFAIGMLLCAYTFYLTSHGQMGSPVLFLILCPFSILAIALDNAGVIGGILGWLFISGLNATLYGAIASEFAARKHPH
jgi:hypothetical protein